MNFQAVFQKKKKKIDLKLRLLSVFQTNRAEPTSSKTHNFIAIMNMMKLNHNPNMILMQGVAGLLLIYCESVSLHLKIILFLTVTNSSYVEVMFDCKPHPCSATLTLFPQPSKIMLVVSVTFSPQVNFRISQDFY